MKSSLEKAPLEPLAVKNLDVYLYQLIVWQVGGTLLANKK